MLNLVEGWLSSRAARCLNRGVAQWINGLLSGKTAERLDYWVAKLLGGSVGKWIMAGGLGFHIRGQIFEVIIWLFMWFCCSQFTIYTK